MYTQRFPARLQIERLIVQILNRASSESHFANHRSTNRIGTRSMGHFLEVARRVLEEVEEPLSARDIVEIGLAYGWLETNGKTPAQTMKSKLSVDIRRNGTGSPFMRTEPGVFALRSWTEEYSEYQARRSKAALMDEEIPVFPRSILPKYVSGPGLHTQPLDKGRELVNECRRMLRREAEENPDYVQLISVYVLRYQNKYLTYKRSRWLPENRLHHHYSMFFGGHITWQQFSPLLNIFLPDVGPTILGRELEEEVRLLGPEPQLGYKGLLYDDSRPVSRQHLGIVYDVTMATKEFEIGERGFLIDPAFRTLNEIKNMADRFENWSLLILRHELLLRDTA